MTAGPIEAKHDSIMNALAELLDDNLPGYGFCLLVFDKNTSEGRMNYIANVDRADMLCAMKEFIAANEGRTPPVSGVIQ